MTIIKRCEKEVPGSWADKQQQAKTWLTHFVPHYSRRCLLVSEAAVRCPASHNTADEDSKKWLDDEHCCTPKKEYRRRRQRVRCLLTAYAVEGFLCGQTAKEDLPPLAAAKLAGRRGVRGTPAAWRTSDALYSTSSTISSSASIFSSSISFSFSSRALKSITKSL